jgi:hypothetical protein
MVVRGIVWVGDPARLDGVPPATVAIPYESLQGKWTRSEKILLLGVVINAAFLAWELIKVRQT